MNIDRGKSIGASSESLTKNIDNQLVSIRIRKGTDARNRKNLESLQAILDLYLHPTPEQSSQIAARLIKLKWELRGRIERFATLELRLLELNSTKIKEDILQKKKDSKN